VFHEDIGRHNAIDKVFGQCLLQGISLDQRLIITSGRVSSEIVYKVAKQDIPILISKSAPTDRGVALADGLGVTLVGFVRDNKMNVYTNRWRVTQDRR
jgi:FdhD protein